ncbi:MAG: acetyl/propionyl/methylcrotonyl-CoA carboxylase subunit alpha [Acidimicrobiales bacterium]
MKGIGSVLVANRGEIVVRIVRTLRALGVRSIAVYADDDAGAPHVLAADTAYRVDSYLDADAIVAAAALARADAVHPGYGFLSEDPVLAWAVIGAGLLWVGPPPAAIETMGDKIRAKQTAAAAGVPVVPGTGRRGMGDEELVAAALDVGFPVLLKPAAGGGGKGMRRVAVLEDLRSSITAARREAKNAFGDDTIFVERWVERPRHIEVQVLADAHGNVVHLGERECSLQRRHQKIVEESPSPFVDDAMRAAMSQSALAVARSCGYVGAGTVEFIVPGDRPDEYYFMEMNTRLQVEHPVTETVTGIDLVEWQLRVTAGEPLPVVHDVRTAPAFPPPRTLPASIACRGHAVEARVYAEDPARGFLPATGTVAAVALPASLPDARQLPHVRVDAALAPGGTVGTRYDPMLAKVVTWGATREEALDRLRAALEETAVLGITTNVGYLVRLLGHPEVVAGHLDTGLVDRTLSELAAPEEADTRDAAVAALCALAAGLEPRGPVIDPWEVPDGWTVAGPRQWEVVLGYEGRAVAVGVQGRVADGASARVDDGPWLEVRAQDRGAGELALTIDGATGTWRTAARGNDVWVGHRGDTWRFSCGDHVRRGGGEPRRLAGPVTSPMPGVVVAVHVGVGEAVRAGQPLVAIEAMKMEHVVVAPVDGVVTELLVKPGQPVGLDQLLGHVEDAAGRPDVEGPHVEGPHVEGPDVEGNC